MSLPDLGLLLLRLGAGGLLLFAHGWGKLIHFNERSATFADPIGLGPFVSLALVVFAEVVCSALVMIGLATRLATIPILIFFMVAAFVQHAADPWAKRELPLVYAVAFVAILMIGPGRYSLDALIGRRRR